MAEYASRTTWWPAAKVALRFTFALLETGLSVYNAIITGSRIIGKDMEEATYAMSAAMEAVGLAFGLGMAAKYFSEANEDRPWQRMLTEPYMLTAVAVMSEGLVRFSSTNDFRVGLIGILLQTVVVLCLALLAFMKENMMAYIFIGILAVSVTTTLCFCCCYWCTQHLETAQRMPEGQGCQRNIPYVVLVSGVPLIPMVVEVGEAYFLQRKDLSVASVILIALDVVAAVPLAVWIVWFVFSLIVNVAVGVLIVVIAIVSYETGSIPGESSYVRDCTIWMQASALSMLFVCVSREDISSAHSPTGSSGAV